MRLYDSCDFFQVRRHAIRWRFCGFKLVGFAVSEEIMGVLPQDAFPSKFSAFLQHFQWGSEDECGGEWGYKYMVCTPSLRSGEYMPPCPPSSDASICVIRYDTIRDAILTCAQKSAQVSLICRTQRATCVLWNKQIACVLCNGTDECSNSTNSTTSTTCVSPTGICYVRTLSLSSFNTRRVAWVNFTHNDVWIVTV